MSELNIEELVQQTLTLADKIVYADSFELPSSMGPLLQDFLEGVASEMRQLMALIESQLPDNKNSAQNTEYFSILRERFERSIVQLIEIGEELGCAQIIVPIK